MKQFLSEIAQSTFMSNENSAEMFITLDSKFICYQINT